jgi:YfiH family protein
MPFTEHRRGELVYFTAPSFGVPHAFPGRLGGVSGGALASLNLGRTRKDEPAAVAENFRRLAEAVGADFSKLVLAQQVHSDCVRAVTEADALPELYAPTPFDADGLVTNVPGLTLAVFYADCLPILLYDPLTRAAGAVHSGWRGTALQISARAVEKMGRCYGSKPENILAAIGPGIARCCFETDGDVPDALRGAFGGGAEPFIRDSGGGKFHVDLPGLVGHTLQAAGVPAGNISQSGLCTRCRPELFWSHRRLGEARGNQAAVIQISGIGEARETGGKGEKRGNLGFA